MNSYGGKVSSEIKGEKEVGMNFLDALELCTIAVSLGAAKPLIEYPTSMTHSTYTAEGLKRAGIPEGLIRLSVGLENVEDIVADLKQVFLKI